MIEAALRANDLATFLQRRFDAINAWDKAEFERTKAAAGI
jgi:23S rRNA G2445 N2-methylase RlmL